jgi:dihydroorotase
MRPTRPDSQQFTPSEVSRRQFLASGSVAGHGGGSFDFTICEPVMMQGAHVGTISSDIHAVTINTPGYPTLPWVMSKFLTLGLSLEDVVQRATVEPAKIIGRVDTRQNRKGGTKKLVPVLTVKGGRPFGR